MLRAAFVVVLGWWVMAGAMAAQTFSCGGAEVKIAVIKRDSKNWEERAEAVVTVSKEGYSTVLRYRHLDFIGGACVPVRDAVPMVAFQAYCGGSGCNDGANWGIIETATLRVLTVPSDANRPEAQRLLGTAALPALTMISVLTEEKALGITAP